MKVVEFTPLEIAAIFAILHGFSKCVPESDAALMPHVKSALLKLTTSHPLFSEIAAESIIEMNAKKFRGEK